MELRPDFNRILKAFWREGEPDRVPLAELGVAPQIMSEFLGHPFRTTKDRVDFFAMAGYDYVKLSPIVNMNPAGIQPKEQSERNINRAEAVDRDWAPEGQGMITSREEFDRYVWPDPRDISYEMFEETPSLLPQGMGVIGQYGDIFTLTWELMGFETFSYALVDQTDLVEDLWNTVGEIIYGMFKKMAAYEFVGALWYSDDIAYQTGLLVSLGLLAVMLYSLWNSPFQISGAPVAEGAGLGLGRQLLTKFVLPFEIVSVLLLAALIGNGVVAVDDARDCGF